MQDYPASLSRSYSLPQLPPLCYLRIHRRERDVVYIRSEISPLLVVILLSLYPLLY
jgi:hypothetical protein